MTYRAELSKCGLLYDAVGYYWLEDETVTAFNLYHAAMIAHGTSPQETEMAVLRFFIAMEAIEYTNAKGPLPEGLTVAEFQFWPELVLITDAHYSREKYIDIRQDIFDRSLKHHNYAESNELFDRAARWGWNWANDMKDAARLLKPA